MFLYTELVTGMMANESVLQMKSFHFTKAKGEGGKGGWGGGGLQFKGKGTKTILA